MSFNVGTADRIVRLLLGIGLVAFAFYSHGPIRWIGLAGAVFIITAIFRFCPAYWVLRIETIGSTAKQAM